MDRASGVSLPELVAGLTTSALPSGLDIAICGIQYDSRAIRPGDLFVALRGGYVDGHDFVAAAAGAGARAAVVDRKDRRYDLPVVHVADTRQALPTIAARFFGFPARELQVIGITGTDGKTTTSYLADHLMRRAGHRTGLAGTVSIRIGEQLSQHESRQTTPESLEVQRLLRQMAGAGVDWTILEATSHGLALHRLDEIEFTVAAVTNITHEHLDFHGTVECYRRAKAILFERLSRDRGVAVVNLDDAGARSVLPYSAGKRLVTYAVETRDADVSAWDVSSGIDGSRFLMAVGQERIPVHLPLPGRFNVENALCAAGIGLAAGLSMSDIARGLECAPQIPGRMVRVDEGQPFAVLIDYAHTPESLAKLLQLVRELSPDGRLLCVSGSAGERDIAKRPLQGAVSARFADISVFTSEDPRYEDPDVIIAQIAKGATEAGGIAGSTVHCVTDRHRAIELAMELARAGDIVLLTGKGHEQSIIVGSEKLPWDEESVARGLLAEMGFGHHDGPSGKTPGAD